jgi:hypothetical protein
MKKLVLTTLAISGLSVAAFAQGVVNWTGAAGFVVGQTNGTAYSSFTPSGSGNPGGTVGNTGGTTAGLTYYYELLVSSSAVAVPTTVAGLAAWSDTGLGATDGTSSNGRITQTAGTTASTANNLPAGATENDILVGWSANLGTTWASALADLQSDSGWVGTGYFGISALGNITGIASPGPGNAVFGTSPGQIAAQSPTQLELNQLAVPEPTSIALAAIGGASLLMFRRKK